MCVLDLIDSINILSCMLVTSNGKQSQNDIVLVIDITSMK